MKRYASFGLLALLLAAAVILSSCGGSGSGGEQGSSKQTGDGSICGMQDVDHSNMDHGSGGMMDASGMLMENGKYSDERFIDMMVPHHQGAIEMAEAALENAEHLELRQLAENIIADQQAEIERLRAIKEREFGSSEVPMEMSPDEIEMMGMREDHDGLANQKPFDKAFIDAMIPHHVGAIRMVNVAVEITNNDEIRELAQDIVEVQEAEIEQMTG